MVFQVLPFSQTTKCQNELHYAYADFATVSRYWFSIINIWLVYVYVCYNMYKFLTGLYLPLHSAVRHSSLLFIDGSTYTDLYIYSLLSNNTYAMRLTTLKTS